MKSALLAVLLSLAGAAPVFAAGGTGEYTLPWAGKGETLAYQSCGCADACWVAEVRSVRSKVAKASLRCDCEKLYFKRGRGRERLHAQSCSAINERSDKPLAIRAELENLLNGDKK